MASEPTTLTEAVLYFQNPDNCREYMVPRRWANGVTCPTCGTERVKFQPQHNRWQCSVHHTKRQFTLKTGTVMEESPIGLDKWLTAMWLVASNRNGISSWELHRALGITQKTAWFLLHRVRLAMQDSYSGGKLGGEVEVDETFIGGKARNMHKDRKRRSMGWKSGGVVGKTAVQGLLERHGKVSTKVMRDAKRRSLVENVKDTVLLDRQSTPMKPWLTIRC
jgi:transposase-like protein